MMQCPNCRKRIKPGMTQCPRCGTPVMSNPQPSFQQNFPQNPQANAQPYPQSYQQSNAKQKAKPRMENPGCVVAFLALLGVCAASSAMRQDTPFSEPVTADTESVYDMTGEAVPETAPLLSDAVLQGGEMTETTAVSMSEDAYLSMLRVVLHNQESQDVTVTNITLQDRVLIVTVDLSRADLALSLAGDLTDAILSVDTSYWDAVKVDFGAFGSVTKNKSEAISGAFGYYFDIPSLDS